MPKLVVCGYLIVTLCLLAGCGSKTESAVEATTAAFNELADRLEQVTTQEQIVAAKPDIEKIGGKLQAAMKRMKTLDQQSNADNAALAAKLGPAMATARQRALKQIQRISSTIDPLAQERITAMLGVQ